jgi:hypothetical protein
MNDDEIDQLLAENRFPIGDPLGAGSYRCYQHLLGTHTRKLYLGKRTHGSPDRFLVSVIWGPNVPVDQLRRELGYRMPGLLDLEHVGYFDRVGANPARDLQREQHCALVELLPPDGEWVPRLTDAALGPARAAMLGSSVGDILHRAADGGVLLIGARPEYIWARSDGRAAGLTGRNQEFFAHTGGEVTVSGALFRRQYYAPEVYLGRGQDERSLVFTLAIMVAEWATGAYPFPTAWAGGNMHSLCEGKHAPLDLPAPLRALLERSLSRDPAQRPALAELVERLRAAAT